MIEWIAGIAIGIILGSVTERVISWATIKRKINQAIKDA